jgi:hypothetical protein
MLLTTKKEHDMVHNLWAARRGLDLAGNSIPAAIEAAESLPDEPEHDDDPQWVYDLTKMERYAGWPCGECRVRRDEHADQAVQSAFPDLDITDHMFVETNLAWC